MTSLAAANGPLNVYYIQFGHFTHPMVSWISLLMIIFCWLQFSFCMQWLAPMGSWRVNIYVPGKMYVSIRVQHDLQRIIATQFIT